MRIVLQRVKEAAVSIQGTQRAGIGCGLLGLVGFMSGEENIDRDMIWSKLASKIVQLRIFPDAQGKLNLSLPEFGGELLLVPQFTLYADCRKGRRPGFNQALEPQAAERLFALFADEVRNLGCGPQTGIFGAEMDVSLVNWGPVTIILDSADF